MIILKCWAKSLFILGLLSLAHIQTGCMAISVLKGEPGLNISAIKVGTGKAEVEETLGYPVHEWVTPSGIRYCVYIYDAGVSPSASDAAGLAFLDVITLGLPELLNAIKPMPGHRKREKMVVSYDADSRALGVFDHHGDLDYLPSDGRVAK